MEYLNKYKSYVKDWRTWYKLFFFVLGTFAVIFMLVHGLINIDEIKNGEKEVWAIYDANGVKNYDYGGYIVWYFSYFTQQSNVIVIAWFLLAFILPWREGKNKFLSQTGGLLTSTYISITALIFWFMLIPAGLASPEGISWSGLQWFSNIVLHTIIPIAMVLYFVLFMHKEKTYETKRWFKNFSWLTFVYPLIYGIYILIRGEVRIASGKEFNNYPYFFFEIHKNVNGMPGAAWFIIAIIIIFAIAVGFSTLYVYATNKVGNKYAPEVKLNTNKKSA